MTITASRKRHFCQALLAKSAVPVGFADVGSGGALKSPWSFLGSDHIRIFGFEPAQGAAEGLPLCVSDRSKVTDFFIAKDERASSLLQPNAAFVDRFAQDSMNTAKTIRVACTTLDEHFAGHYRDIDAIDVNVEGHDLQVLRGGTALLDSGGVKLIKVEFELAEAWVGQGWYGEIDQFLRARGYDLVGIEINFIRPANVRNVAHFGEPVWGKALYAPCDRLWRSRIQEAGADCTRDDIIKAIALYVAAEVPGRSFDLVDLAVSAGKLSATDGDIIKRDITEVFRWARVEQGLGILRELASKALRRVF